MSWGERFTFAALFLLIGFTIIGSQMDTEPTPQHTTCTGPISGRNSDVCADIEQEWSP